MTARELTEWEAYERATGPLNRLYSDDMLALIHEQLQALNYLTGSQADPNPMPEPVRMPRPDESIRPAQESDGNVSVQADEDDEIYTDFESFDAACFPNA